MTSDTTLPPADAGQHATGRLAEPPAAPRTEHQRDRQRQHQREMTQLVNHGLAPGMPAMAAAGAAAAGFACFNAAAASGGM